MSISFYIANALHEDLIGALAMVDIDGITVNNGGLVTAVGVNESLNEIEDAIKNAYEDGIDESFIAALSALRKEVQKHGDATKRVQIVTEETVESEIEA